jgi:hypothetical protein
VNVECEGYEVICRDFLVILESDASGLRSRLTQCSVKDIRVYNEIIGRITYRIELVRGGAAGRTAFRRNLVGRAEYVWLLSIKLWSSS